VRDRILNTLLHHLCPTLAGQLKREALRRKCAHLVIQDRAA